MNGVFIQSGGMKPMPDRLNQMQQLKESRRTFCNCLGALKDVHLRSVARYPIDTTSASSIAVRWDYSLF